MEKRGKRSVDKKKERAKEEQAKTGQAKKEAVKKEEAKNEQSLKEQRKKEDRMSEDGDGKQGLKARLLMCLLYLAVLSTATYAWFTMNNSPPIIASTHSGSSPSSQITTVNLSIPSCSKSGRSPVHTVFSEAKGTVFN